MKPLDTSPRRSYRRARRKHGLSRRRAAALTAHDTLLQLRSYWRYHTLIGHPRGTDG